MPPKRRELTLQVLTAPQDSGGHWGVRASAAVGPAEWLHQAVTELVAVCSDRVPVEGGWGQSCGGGGMCNLSRRGGDAPTRWGGWVSAMINISSFIFQRNV